MLVYYQLQKYSMLRHFAYGGLLKYRAVFRCAQRWLIFKLFAILINKKASRVDAHHFYSKKCATFQLSKTLKHHPQRYGYTPGLLHGRRIRACAGGQYFSQAVIIAALEEDAVNYQPECGTGAIVEALAVV